MSSGHTQTCCQEGVNTDCRPAIASLCTAACLPRSLPLLLQTQLSPCHLPHDKRTLAPASEMPLIMASNLSSSPRE